MTLSAAAATVLSRGTLLKIIYQEQNNLHWSLVAHKVLLEKLNIAKNVNGTIVDLLLEQEFNFSDKNIIGFEYCGLPPAVTAQDLLNDTELNKQFGQLFLLDIDHYIDNVTNIITEEYSKFITFLTEQLEPYNIGDESIINDLYYVRFYPHTNMKADNITSLVKADIIKKYHIFSNKDSFIRPALKKFGLTNEIIDVTEERFISALKRVWFNYIKTFANNILLKLSTERARYELEAINFEKFKSTYSGILTKKDFIDFVNQIKDYEDILKDIKFSILDNCKSVKEILSCWPPALYPQPFLYDDY